jgi:integrase
MIERGAPVALIQSLVGHVNARMVRHYTHVTTGAARNAVALLDGEPIFKQIASNRAVQLELQLR